MANKNLTHRQRVAKGNRAAKLLESKELKEAFANVENAYMAMIKDLPPSDLPGLVILKERLHLLRVVEEDLHAMIRDGKLASSQLVEDERPPYLGDIVQWRMKQAQNK
jgi:hypothetical protein